MKRVVCLLALKLMTAWTVQANSLLSVAPVLCGDKLIAVSPANNKVACFEIASERCIWETTISDIVVRLAEDMTNVVVATRNHQTLLFEGSSGRLLSTSTYSGYPLGATGGNLITLGNSNSVGQVLVSTRVIDGACRWRKIFPHSDKLYYDGLLFGNVVTIVSTKRTLAGTVNEVNQVASNALICIDARSGQSVWDECFLASPADVSVAKCRQSEGMIIWPAGGIIRFIDSLTGQVKLRWSGIDAITSGSTGIVMTVKGIIEVIDLKTGHKVKTFSIQDHVECLYADEGRLADGFTTVDLLFGKIVRKEGRQNWNDGFLIPDGLIHGRTRYFTSPVWRGNIRDGSLFARQDLVTGELKIIAKYVLPTEGEFPRGRN